MPVYTPLNITTCRRGTVYILQEINGVAFTIVTVQQPNNINNLTLAIMVGLVIILLS